MPNSNWRRSFAKAIRWGAFLAALVTIVLIGVIWMVQQLLVLAGDPKLFDLVPLRYIFDVVDLGILAAFLFFGTREAIVVFKESSDDSE